ncbi:MAG: hypothetical protein MR283_04750 [Erysipelotrichaceae bacterium]|nr:hypothetical protein [Erysipelotrichaceae bacterium]
MSARCIFIGSFVGLGIFYILLYALFYRYITRTQSDGTRVIDEAVNTQDRQS